MLVALLLNSCATIILGSKQKVQIKTEPPGAQVYVNGNMIDQTTPCKITIDKRDHVRASKYGNRNEIVYTFMKEGFSEIEHIDKSRANWLIAVDFYAFFIPGVIDLISKAHRVYNRNVFVKLPAQKTIEVERTNRTTITDNTTEKPEQFKYRGSGDPLKGLNVANANQQVEIGNYYALLIGIDKYQGEWSPLENAVNDAKAIETLLQSKYRFDQYSVLYDSKATRTAIIKQLEWLVETVQENDNVFIYYSGHGEFKGKLNKGYWVPYDAKSKSISEYISNNDIQAFLQGIKSKHTLLVSDACFSGDIFRGTTFSVPFESSEKYYRKVHNLVSRKAITSGGIEPVMDGGREGHSVFAYYFIQSLRNNEAMYFDASELYNSLKIPVVNNSEQIPKFNPIKNTGDEGGQFIFIKK